MVQAEVAWSRNAELYDAKEVPTISLFNNYFGVWNGINCIPNDKRI